MFLCHCSLAGKEMTAGVSCLTAATTSLLRTTCPALGLQASFRLRFSPPFGFCHASPLGSVLDPRPTPPPPTVHCTPHSHTPGRLNTEELSNAYLVDTRGREDRKRSRLGMKWSSQWLGAAARPHTHPFLPWVTPPPQVKKGRERSPHACPCTAVSLTHLQTFGKASFGAKAPSQLPTTFSDASQC